ncbi:MAG: hypothetical protein O3C28_04280 [Proteobacteria bacterium]|nr:hypothetical protein [Pseudomonadota bacterium]
MFSEFARYETLLPSTAPATLQDLPIELRIYADDAIEVWYSPMGAATENAKIWILGITPGWNQMQIAYASAADARSNGTSPHAAAAMKKPAVAFAGSMRHNLVTMMDELGVHDIFSVSTSANLFGSEQLRTGSVLKYPVFRHGSNYAGHSPKPLKHPALREMVDVVLARELKANETCLVLPLGKAVESVLLYSASKGLIRQDRILSGFPHPSGANGHRKKQFEQNKPKLQAQIRRWF